MTDALLLGGRFGCDISRVSFQEKPHCCVKVRLHLFFPVLRSVQIGINHGNRATH